MGNYSNRRGISIASVIALLGSLLFVASPANAAATDGAQIAIRPVAGSATNLNGLISEDFPIYAQLLEGTSTSNWATGKVRVEVTKTSGNVDVLLTSTTVSNKAIQYGEPASSSYLLPGDASTVVDYIDQSNLLVKSVASVSAYVNNSAIAPIYLKAYSTSSLANTSSSVVLQVKVYIDNQGGSANGVHDADEWYTIKTVTLKGNLSVAPTVTLTAPTNGDTTITVSSTLTDINTANLNGYFFLAVTSSQKMFLSAGSYEASGLSRPGSFVYSNSSIVSQSFAVAAVTASTTVSASLRYHLSESSTFSDGVALGTDTSRGNSGTNGVTSVTVTPVYGSNATTSGGVTLVRANQTVTVKAGALSGSTSVSSLALNVSMTFSGSLAEGGKTISINGGSATTSLPTALAITTGDDGYASFTIGSDGFADGDKLFVTVAKNDISADVILETDDINYALANVYDNYKSAPGTSVAVAYAVRDQWGSAPLATDDLRIKVARSGANFGFAPNTISYHVVDSAGNVTVDFVPAPAAATGSATLTTDLQKRSSSLNAWNNTSDQVTTTVNVAAGSDSFVSAIATSYSTSVSYFPATLSWATVTGTVANTGSAVVASGTGLIFKDSTGATSSDSMTFRAGSGVTYTIYVGSTLAGSYTMTLTNGTAVTSAPVVVDAAAHDSGKAISFDTTSIDSGRTKVVTGTVVDMNGNPVDTSAGAATIVVSYAGTAGIPVGSMPVETDASGEFRVSILTSATDNGSFTLTATYLKSGTSTLAADKVTKVQTITVAPASAADSSDTSSDTKVNAGSFKGYVAVYAKGYAGKRMSAKIGNDWVVVESLASNFERVVDFTGAGYTIAVRIYIDRVLVDTITVTTK